MTAPATGRPVVPGRGVVAPLGLGEVAIGPGFWGDRQRLNGEVVLAHCRSWMERVGWIDNFRAAADGRLPADRRGREFSDADVYKLIEALCWEAGRTGRADLDEAVGALGRLVAGAQHPDGYLNTHSGHLEVADRYRDLEWGHELYCVGHLLQAMVARLRTGGADDDVLVAAGRRAADHVCGEFGPGGREGVDGHPEIETALVELYRATGEERYLAQARSFVERRGRPALADIELGRAYYQDDVPVRAARALRGHAVRALYLACGAVDVAVETDDRELLEAVAEQWRHTLAARTHLTGGMGSRHDGEAFGEDYELPPDRAYAETCAGVAAVMLAWRLLLATGEGRYAETAERILFNVVATSPARDGRTFFYCNPLQIRVPPPVPDPGVDSPRAATGLRAPWFHVACCPPNVARLLASLSAYVATTSGGRGSGEVAALQLHQLVPGTVEAPLADGGAVRLRIETDYPWSGGVRVRVEDCPATPWRLDVRVPAWVGEARLAVDEAVRRGGGPDRRDGLGGGWTVTRPQAASARGYARVDRVWRVGDELRVELPVRPRWTYPDPRVDALRGCVAVERGPLVYCAESLATDAPTESIASPAEGSGGSPARPSSAPSPEAPAEGSGGSPARPSSAPSPEAPAEGARPGDPLTLVAVDDASEPVDLDRESMLDDAITVAVTVRDVTPALDRGGAAIDPDGAYRTEPPAAADDSPVRTLALIPYHLWGNRGPATMRVWLPTC